MRALVVAFALAAAPAFAAGEEQAIPITVTPSPESVTVTVVGVIPEGKINASGDLLQLSLAGAPPPVALDVKDDTLRRIEIVDGKISLQLRHGRDTTLKIAAGSKLASSTGGFTIAFPRKNHPAVAAATAPPALVAEPTPPPAPAAAAVTTTPPPVVAAPPIAAAPPATATPNTMPGIPGSATSPFGFAVAGILGIAALGAYLFAKRKKGDVTKSALKVVATTPMGARSRLVLVAAGERELLLAVDPKGVTLIEKWRSEPAENEDEADFAAAAEPKFALKPASPAVSGLLKLRHGKERA